MQLPASGINAILDIWGASLLKHGEQAPFSNHKEMYKMIDSIPLADVPWSSFSMEYGGDHPKSGTLPWMNDKHKVWYRDPCKVIQHMLANPDFNGEFDYAPLQELDANGNPRFKNFMSGSWAWDQVVS